MLFDAIQKHPAKHVALRDKYYSIPYGKLPSAIDDYVKRLANVRVLGIALDNGVEWVLWDLAALKAGIICVPLPPFFTPEQIQHAIQTAGISHLITPKGLVETNAKPAPLLPDGTAKITYTSGSTGNPKGVCLPRVAMERVASGIVQKVGVGLSHHCPILPLAVLLENVAGVYAALLAGSTVTFTPLATFGKHYESLHETLQSTQADTAILVPELLRVLLAQVLKKGPLPHLRFLAVGGAKIDSGLIMQARKAGLPVYEGYGLSECASVVSLNVPGDDCPGSVGKTLPHVQLEIDNGEIVIQHPGFLGYVGETAPTLFRTGDLGTVDSAGNVTLQGRIKNLLITSFGRNVSPEWVESTLLAQPEILQAVVYGDGQPMLGALLVPSYAGADIAAAVRRANQLLPDYAQIHSTTTVPPFTQENGFLTGNGRVRRDAILAAYPTILNKEKAYEFLSNAG